MIHGGSLIRDYLKKNKITISEFAKIINRSDSATYKILSGKSSISISLLYVISVKLKHDFFNDISRDYLIIL